MGLDDGNDGVYSDGTDFDWPPPWQTSGCGNCAPYPPGAIPPCTYMSSDYYGSVWTTEAMRCQDRYFFCEYPKTLTQAPTSNPTKYPTINPTASPTAAPTHITINPTAAPSATPTAAPTNYPSFDPTKYPSNDPTSDPTDDPTVDPTADPTIDPTTDPTIDPTADPSVDPTDDPTTDPTGDPTVDPTDDPTDDPTPDPTNDPTNDPTVQPTVYPSGDPTMDPTNDPTGNPTTSPSNAPSAFPTPSPTNKIDFMCSDSALIEFDESKQVAVNVDILMDVFVILSITDANITIYDIKVVDMNGISVSDVVFDALLQSVELYATENVLFKLYSDEIGTVSVNIECKSIANDGVEKDEEIVINGQTTLLIIIISVLAIALLIAICGVIYYKQAAAKSAVDSLQMVDVVSPQSTAGSPTSDEVKQ